MGWDISEEDTSEMGFTVENLQKNQQYYEKQSLTNLY